MTYGSMCALSTALNAGTLPPQTLPLHTSTQASLCTLRGRVSSGVLFLVAAARVSVDSEGKRAQGRVAGTPQLLGEQHASPPRVARRGARRDPARQLQPAVETQETRQKQLAMQCASEYGAIHADGVVHWQERPHAPGWWVARHCGSVCVFVSSRSVLERCANFERDHRGGGAERRACRDAFEDPANRDPGFRSCPADVARRPKIVCLATPCLVKQRDLPGNQICVNSELVTS